MFWIWERMHKKTIYPRSFWMNWSRASWLKEETYSWAILNSFTPSLPLALTEQINIQLGNDTLATPSCVFFGAFQILLQYAVLFMGNNNTFRPRRYDLILLLPCIILTSDFNSVLNLVSRTTTHEKLYIRFNIESFLIKQIFGKWLKSTSVLSLRKKVYGRWYMKSMTYKAL